MGGEWIETTVGEFCPFEYGKGLPERKRKLGPYPVFGSNGRVGSHVEPLIKSSGIIIGRKGTVGSVHFSKVPFWPIDTAFYVVDASHRDLRFTYYMLQSLGLDQMNADSAVPGLNRTAAHARNIKVPPLSEQQAIACILGTLDDKIELNRRMNQTLEEMARAIFKSWFVDFDPVRAKAAGQQPPGLKPEIASLFPDSFEDSELGEIPRGWRVLPIGELAEVSSGKRPNARFAERTDEASVPLWGGNGPMAFVRKALFDEPVLLTGRVGTLGSVFRITEPCWPSDNTLVLQATEPSVFQYLFLQLHQVNFTSLNRGSTQPLLTQTDLKAQRLVVSTKSILETFSRIADSMYCRFDESTAEILTLVAIRDTLLPKLISSELRLPDAERITERCL